MRRKLTCRWQHWRQLVRKQPENAVEEEDSKGEGSAQARMTRPNVYMLPEGELVVWKTIFNRGG